MSITAPASTTGLRVATSGAGTPWAGDITLGGSANQDVGVVFKPTADVDLSRRAWIVSNAAYTSQKAYLTLAGDQYAQSLTLGTGSSVASPIRANCSGVATASATLFPLGLGGSALTCTDTTENLGTVITSAGTIGRLYAVAKAAGKTAASGVLVVRKNAGATALTCTIGLGTTCTDTAHSFTVVAGDVLTVSMATDAGETLANVSVALEKW